MKRELNVYERDIFAQPEDMRRSLRFFREQDYYSKMLKIGPENYEKILFTGIGSSYSSCINIARELENKGFNVSLKVASDLVYYEMESITKDTLVVAVSQSGESGEIVSLIERLDPDVKMVSITNNPDSTLGKRGTYTFLMHVDDELAVSTRTYLSSLMLQYMLLGAFTGRCGEKVCTELERAISFLDDTVASFDEMTEKMISVLGHPDHLAIIGRGWSYETVDAGSLFTKEVAKYPTIPFDGAQFRHGPFEMVVFDFSAVILAPKGAGSDMQLKLAKDLAERGGKIAVVTDREDIEDSKGICIIRQKYINEIFAPFSQIVALQCFGNYMAKSRGIAVGEFVYGTKVTVVQ